MINHHTTIQELLPWYVNGTLNTREMILVQNHLADCPQCSAAVGQELTIARSGQPSAADAQRLQILETQRGANFARLQSSLTTPQSRQGKSRYVQACLMLFVLVVGGTWLWPRQIAQPPAFEAMTDPAADSIVLQVAFTEGLETQDLDNILNKIGGSLLNAPIHTSITRIRLAEADRVEQSLAFLNANPSVIWVGRER